ncbi:MAG: HPP family protein [Bacillota bacterium]|uniref:CBS domain-containing protein n=1 Tax=Desulfurispora thermophila TaxID=265470 RepID=UPI000366CE9B|nr:CBS domain-containing protein [Desulfurispora thermophila]
MRAGNSRAGDIMVPVQDYITIYEDQSVFEAIKKMRQSFHQISGALHGHRSMLVLDRAGNLTGIVTLKSLLRALGLKELAEDIIIRAESWGWYFTGCQWQDSKLCIKDVMRPISLATVDVEDDIYKAAETLLRHNINSLPVMNGKKLVGIIRTIDIFMALDNLFLE